MTKVTFNIYVLQYYLDSDDELYSALAKECVKHFSEYTKIVNEYHNTVNNLRKTKSGDGYRQAVQELDTKRRNVHNDCLSDIRMLNKMAERDKVLPFAKYEGEPNRTDFGHAIVEMDIDSLID